MVRILTNKPFLHKNYLGQPGSHFVRCIRADEIIIAHWQKIIVFSLINNGRISFSLILMNALWQGNQKRTHKGLSLWWLEHWGPFYMEVILMLLGIWPGTPMSNDKSHYNRINLNIQFLNMCQVCLIWHHRYLVLKHVYINSFMFAWKEFIVFSEYLQMYIHPCQAIT